MCIIEMLYLYVIFLFKLELLGTFAHLYIKYLHICISRSCHKFVVVCNCSFQLAFMGTIALLYTKYLLLYLQVFFIYLKNRFFARGCICR
jgi:hypothetical protein